MNRHLRITILELTTRLAFKITKCWNYIDAISSINCLFFNFYISKMIVFGIFDMDWLESFTFFFSFEIWIDDKTASNINKWQTFESRAYFLLFVAIPFCYCIDIFIVQINRIVFFLLSSIDLDVVTSLNYACNCILNFKSYR